MEETEESHGTRPPGHLEQCVLAHIQKMKQFVFAQRASRIRVCQPIPSSTNADLRFQERVEPTRWRHVVHDHLSVFVAARRQHLPIQHCWQV